MTKLHFLTKLHAAWTMATAHAWQTNTWLAQNRSYRNCQSHTGQWQLTALAV